MLKVAKRKGSENYQITGTVITPNGSEFVRKSSGTSIYAEAVQAASALEARIRRELIYGVEKETTFAEAAYDYIKAKNDDGETVASPKLADLIRLVGTRTLASFSSGEIQDIAKAIFPKAKPATRNRHGIVPFMAVYNFAVLRKKAPPMEVERFEVKKPKTVSVDRLWIEAFRAHCKDPYVRALCRLMFETGMRLGTAIQLSREMLDVEGCWIHAPGTIVKNGEDHSFPLTRDMTDELSGLPDIATFNRESGKRDRRGRNRNPDRLFGFSFNSGIDRHWRRACADAGIKYVPTHQAGKHSFTTVMIVDHGIDPVTVAEIAGSKDVYHLLKNYPHARETKVRAVIERVSGRSGPQSVDSTPNAQSKNTHQGETVIPLRKSNG